MCLWIEPPAREEIKNLPGYMRQRIRRAVKSLSNESRPHRSRELDVPTEVLLPELEARRIRLGKWWIVYVIDEEWATVTVVAVRNRPPYDYSDLAELLADV